VGGQEGTRGFLFGHISVWCPGAVGILQTAPPSDGLVIFTRTQIRSSGLDSWVSPIGRTDFDTVKKKMVFAIKILSTSDLYLTAVYLNYRKNTYRP
jgi:hypothetical protein